MIEDGDDLVMLVSVAVLGVASVGWLLGLETVATVATVVGFVIVVPLVVQFGDRLLEWTGIRDEADGTEPPDPMEELHERYVAGELSEAEFERRIERLLATEEPAAEDAAPVDHEREFES
jgi:uncharacterized membrane protein